MVFKVFYIPTSTCLIETITNKDDYMKRITYLFLIFSWVLICTVNPVSAAEKPSNYIALKGGLLALNEIDIGDDVTIDLDSEEGYGGELAVGHYFLTFLALELEGGYFEVDYSRDSLFLDDAKLKIYPALATLKVLLPLGPIEPFGEFGGGAYFTKLDIEGDQIDFSSDTEVGYGLHAGGGLNINLTETFFLGVEGRYILSKLSWSRDDSDLERIDVDDVEIDGYTATGVLGLRF